MKFVLAIIGATILSGVSFTTPLALDYKHIAGKWCVAGLGTVEFTPTQMFMHFEKTGERRVYTVDEYRDHGETVVVHWRDGRRVTFTEFGDLRAGGTQITQLTTDDAPIRQMERCHKTLPVRPLPN